MSRIDLLARIAPGEVESRQLTAYTSSNGVVSPRFEKIDRKEVTIKLLAGTAAVLIAAVFAAHLLEKKIPSK